MINMRRIKIGNSMGDLDIDDDCIQTFDMLAEELATVEGQLAIRFNLTDNVRAQLLQMDRDNNLVEDEVVARWLELYTIYMDWVRNS